MLGLGLKNAGLIGRSSQGLESLRALCMIQKNLESTVAIGFEEDNACVLSVEKAGVEAKGR